MKKTWIYFIALLTIVAVLASVLIIGSAAEGGSGLVYILRTWDDGYTTDKGFAVVGGTTSVLEREEDDHYFSLKANIANTSAGKIGNCTNAYIQFQIPAESKKDLQFVFEFDVMFPAGGIPTDTSFFVVKDTKSNFIQGSGKNGMLSTVTVSGTTSLYSGGKLLGAITPGEWMHIAICVDFATNKITPYFNGESKGTGSGTSETSGAYPSLIRVNISDSSPLNSEIALDNFSIYQGTEPRDIEGDPGIMIGSSTPGVKAQDYLAMKVNVPHAAWKKTRCEISDGEIGAPFTAKDGTVFVPLEFITGKFGGTYTKNSDTQATVSLNNKTTTVTVGSTEGGLTSAARKKDGLIYVTQDDAAKLLGIYTSYDDMGLILYCKNEVTLTRENGLSEMTTLMNIFILDDDVGTTILSDMTDTLGSTSVHPRLGATQSRFDELRAAYTATPGSTGYNATLQKWIQQYVDVAVKARNSRFNYDSATGTYSLKSPIYQPYFVYEDTNEDGVLECVPGKAGTDMYGKSCKGDGYDDGGRSSVGTYTSELLHYGFAYQMTGDTSYADCFYMIAQELDKWQHWGEGHYLNCADGATPYATGFDWLYHAFDNDQDGGTARRAYLADVLYRKAIFPGWASYYGIYTYPSVRIGTGGSYWKSKTNNWVSVCSSGLLTSVLSVMDFQDLSYTYKGTTYKASTVLTDSVTQIFKYMSQCFSVYAPDGSYIESPGYWSYGTNAHFLMAENLYSCAGDDYGLMDVYGIDKTCDFALNIESSDYIYWNYHDSGSSSMDTSHFSFYGKWFGRKDLISIRYAQIANGKGKSIYDVLYFDASCIGAETENPALDYYCVGIDTFISRSSWDKGAIFTGLHGGPNKASHGNTDCGNFIIYKGKTQFICDLGSDNYNVRDYYGNPKYYRLSAEGANTIVLPALEYGQVTTATAKTIKTYSDDNGSYSLLDTTALYGDYVTTATRGLLFTASRSTVVIQDYIKFKNATDYYWFAHYDTGSVSVSLSKDGRTAYLRSGSQTLRATILTNDESLVFTIMDTYTLVLDGTFTPEESAAYTDGSTTLKGQREKNRSNYSKLAICGHAKSEVDMAVVFDFVDYDSDPVRYEKVKMENWVPSYYAADLSVIIPRNLDNILNNLSTTTDSLDLLKQYNQICSYLSEENVMYLTSDDVNRATAALIKIQNRYELLRKRSAYDWEKNVPLSKYTSGNTLLDVDFSTALSAFGIKETIDADGVMAGIVTDANGQPYYKIAADGSNVENSYLAYNLSSLPKNLCIEFDYSAQTQFATFYLNLRYNTAGYTDALNFTVEDNGTVMFYDADDRTVFIGNDLLRVGDWLHVAIVYHFETLTADLYLNNILVLQDVTFKNAANATTGELRFNLDGGVNLGEICLDNIKLSSSAYPLDIDRHIADLDGALYSGFYTYEELSSMIEYAQQIVDAKNTLGYSDACATYFDHINAMKPDLDSYKSFADMVYRARDKKCNIYDRVDLINAMYVLRHDLFTLPSDVDVLLKQYNALVSDVNKTLGFTDARYAFKPGKGLGTVTLYLLVDDAPVSVKNSKDTEILNKETKVSIDGKEFYAITVELKEINPGRSICFFVDYEVGSDVFTKQISLSLQEYAVSVLMGNYSQAKKNSMMDYLSDAAKALKKAGKDSSEFEEMLVSYQDLKDTVSYQGTYALLPKETVTA